MTGTDSFYTFLTETMHFRPKQAEWIVIWTNRYLCFFHDRDQDRETSLEAFRFELQQSKPESTINLALEAIQIYWYWRNSAGKNAPPGTPSIPAGSIWASRENPLESTPSTSVPTAGASPAGMNLAGSSLPGGLPGGGLLVNGPHRPPLQVLPKHRVQSFVPPPEAQGSVFDPPENTFAPEPRDLKAELDAWQLRKQDWTSRVRELIRLKHQSYRTEQTYLAWTQRFFLNVEKNCPPQTSLATRAITVDDLRNFLSHLAIEDRVSAATQEQALNALLVLFRSVLGLEIPGLKTVLRAQRRKRIPTVFTRDEVRLVMSRLTMPWRLMVQIMYGAGLRLEETLCLRVKDLNFEDESLTVRSGKGDRDRITLFPLVLHGPAKAWLTDLRLKWESERIRNLPGVQVPPALGRKYQGISEDWKWYWLFPGSRPCLDPRGERAVYWHVHASLLQRKVREAVQEAGINKQASVHTFRHSFATHLIEDGYDIRTVQDLLGHRSVQTTMVYTHVAVKNKRGVKSPLSSMSLEPEDPDGNW